MAKKQAIQADADATAKRMDSANKLIGALGGEYTRWKADSEAFADEIRRMAGDVALACAFVCYAGPFNADFRTLLLRERFYKDCVEKKIPVTADMSITDFMVDEGTIGDWAREGLPRDELSVQNGIMVTRSSKWPLLIDPQGQGLVDQAARRGQPAARDGARRQALPQPPRGRDGLRPAPAAAERRGGPRPHPGPGARQARAAVGARLQGRPRGQGASTRRRSACT